MARTPSLPVFSRRLKQARQLRGLSQKSLGIAAGFDEFVASPRVNQYERGVHMPDYETAQRLSAVLLVTTAFLYADDEEIAEALLRLSNMPVRKRRTAVRMLSDE
jgi:transcriptional regulator with XRE-family HTH domain